MKQLRLTILLMTLIILSSCSSGESVSSECTSQTTVKELTAYLARQDSAYVILSEPETRIIMPTVTFTGRDKFKIALADVKGGLRGLGGGVIGVVGGAAVSSLVKAARIYAIKWAVAFVQDNVLNDVFPGTNGQMTFTDSIGYYHNMVQRELFMMNPDSHLASSSVLLSQADSIMMSHSSYYSNAGGLSASALSSLSLSEDSIRSISDDLSMEEYCDALKSLNPEDSDYIDFIAEYAYTALFSNVDLASYTEEVLFTIRNANLSAGDTDILVRSVRIAHASIVYSNNTQLSSKQY